MRTLDEIKRDGEAVKADIAAAEKLIADARDANRKRAEWESAQRQILDLRAQADALPAPPTAVDAAQAKAAEIQAAAVRKEYEIALAMKECEAQRLENTAALGKIAEQMDALAPQIEAAAAMRDEMLRDSTAAFEAAANRLMELLGTGDMFSFARSGPLTFGLYSLEGGFRPYRSLSGGESIICKLAWDIGLMSTRADDIPLKLAMVGDLDRISPAPLQLRVLSALAKLAGDGIIDQTIVEGAVAVRSDADQPAYQAYAAAVRAEIERLGYTIIDLSPATESQNMMAAIAREDGK